MKNKRLQWIIGAGVLVALLLVAVQLAANRADRSGTSGRGPEYYAAFPFAGTAIGNPDAPVTVVEYFDFQCPACQNASDAIVKPLIDEQVRSGDVYFVYRFFPILGPESVAAAEAAYCAAVQDGFWPYQDALFARKGTGNRGVYSRRNLTAAAANVGLDQQAFTECIDSDRARAYVQASYQHAVQQGLPGTPVFFVNEVNVRTTPQAIQQAVEEALADAKTQ